MAGNKNLAAAKANKKDEFYTQRVDIENELKHYKPHFAEQIVYCNCDDPYESWFFKYFAMNFNALGLKKLIATSYDGSSMAGTELAFDGGEGECKAHKIVIDRPIEDYNGDGAVDDDDVRIFLQKFPPEVLVSDDDYKPGDFRSRQCVELLKEADIVVTNPPFSLFGIYLNQLISYNKKFLILGRMSALHKVNIFPHIMDGRVWIGYGFNISMIYKAPYDNTDEANRKYVRSKGYDPDKHYIKVPAICWFTNLDHKKRHERLDLYRTYNPVDYPKYDNYDAIEVGKVTEIPCDYDGVMGVPDTFLGAMNPDQFEVLGASQRGCHDKVLDTKKYDDYWEMTPEGMRTGSSGNKTNENANLERNDGKHNYFINKNGHIVQSTYSRIFIKKREL